MQKEISEYMKRHIEILLDQTKSYQPFIKAAFPTMSVSDACFNLIAANAFSVFLGQYVMRMIVPTQTDFTEFGALIGQYKEKVNEIFAK